jgi:hypothetical protein
MSCYRILPSLSITAAALALCAGTAFAQAGGRGGGGTPGLGRPMPDGGLPTEAIQPNTLNDLEVTQITRAELNGPLPAAAQAVRVARDALLAATFTIPSNAADIRAKSQALAQAEIVLAGARADVYAQLRTSMGNLSAEKRAALINELGG